MVMTEIRLSLKKAAAPSIITAHRYTQAYTHQYFGRKTYSRKNVKKKKAHKFIFNRIGKP